MRYSTRRKRSKPPTDDRTPVTNGARARTGMVQAFRISIIGALLVTAVSCQSESDQPLVVWSNVTDTAFVVERYNAVSERPVDFRFKNNLTESITQEYFDADLVIGRWVNTPEVNTLMADVDSYRDTDGGRASSTAERERPALDIPLSVLAQSPQWVPLSYNLPALAFVPEITHVDTDLSLRIEELAEQTSPHPTASVEPPLLFAPTATRDGIYAVYRSLGFRPTAGEDGGPTWVEEDLTAAVERFRAWQTQTNGSSAEESEYIERYLYEPLLRQLETGKVRFVYRSSNDLFTWTYLANRRFDHRWIARSDGGIDVNEDVVYAGVPKQTKNRADAIALLAWLTRKSVQIDLVEEKVRARIDTFGFLEGFSTLTRANNDIAAAVYPRLVGRVPAVETLIFPGVRPRYWNEAIEQVVAPTLIESEEVSRLSERLRRWYYQRGD